MYRLSAKKLLSLPICVIVIASQYVLTFGGESVRYFKYKNTDKTKTNAFKEQYKTLSAEEKRIFRKKQILEKCGCLVMALILCLTAALGSFLINLIPTPTYLHVKIALIIAKVLYYPLLLFFSVVFAVILSMPVWIKSDSLDVPKMKKEIFSKASAHLRDYYGLNEPYVITKCFDSTDEKFIDCDVCIFVCDGELRITKDIVHGFLHGEKDLGCYAFKADEINLTKQIHGKSSRCELSAKDVKFLLGYRAEKYISENFISNK